MTGAYLRIWRDGRWHNVEIDQLSDAELDALEERSEHEPGSGWMWAKFLAGWIREHVREQDQDVSIPPALQIAQEAGQPDPQPGPDRPGSDSGSGRPFRPGKGQGGMHPRPPVRWIRVSIRPIQPPGRID
jgi:hypothetical protein